MSNNILPAILTTTTIFIGSFLGWWLGIGAGHNYFFEWLPTVVLAAVFAGAIWGLSEGDVSSATSHEPKGLSTIKDKYTKMEDYNE